MHVRACLQVSTQAILCSYLERVMQQCFGSDGPMAAPAGSAEGGGWYSNWSDAAKVRDVPWGGRADGGRGAAGGARRGM